MNVTRVLLLFVALIAHALSVQASDADFRAALVLTAGEAATQDHEVLMYKSAAGEETLSVAKEPVFTAADVESTFFVVVKDPDFGADAFIELHLTEPGKEKLFEFTGKNIRRRMAFVANSRVVQASTIMEAIDGGRLQLMSPSENFSEAAEFARGMGLTLELPSASAAPPLIPKIDVE